MSRLNEVKLGLKGLSSASCRWPLLASLFVKDRCFVVVTSLNGKHVPSWTYRIYIWICFAFESTSSHLLALPSFHAQYLHKGNVYLNDSINENIKLGITFQEKDLTFQKLSSCCSVVSWDARAYFLDNSRRQGNQGVIVRSITSLLICGGNRSDCHFSGR